MVGFRGALIRTMIGAGHSVHCFAPVGDKVTQEQAMLERWGATCTDLRVTRSGLNVFDDFVNLRSLAKQLSRLKPDAILCYNTKTILYGTLAARMAGIRKITVMFEGLGYPFADGSELGRRLIRFAVAAAFRLVSIFANKFIVLNRDDYSYLAGSILSGKVNCLHLIPGIGVDLAEFAPVPLPDGRITFVMISRLLIDKGVREYIGAANAIKGRGLPADFILVGGLDENPASITERELRELLDDGAVKYVGEVGDVRPWIQRSHVFVLPTAYREGAPRTIIEALSMGRPCITTNSPGCRDLVEHGQNGMLVPRKNVQDLVTAMEFLIEEPGLIKKYSAMALQSRDRFDAYDIARQTIEVMLAEPVTTKGTKLSN